MQFSASHRNVDFVKCVHSSSSNPYARLMFKADIPSKASISAIFIDCVFQLIYFHHLNSIDHT